MREAQTFFLSPPPSTLRASGGGGAKFEPQIQNIWLLEYFKGTHTLQSNYHTWTTLYLQHTKLAEKTANLMF